MAQEVIHCLKYKKGFGGLMAMKFDMERAYDKVEWPFLMAIFKKFGFAY